jgi:hypothetical protein
VEHSGPDNNRDKSSLFFKISTVLEYNNKPVTTLERIRTPLSCLLLLLNAAISHDKAKVKILSRQDT